ncbi:class I SAM-dependent methyltransferase [Plantactinospora sp. GCM10030261]|uniref:class I SAM-dependent methyltransferase n=1 Tax=Plantactinospora sp. GCM10030261 TaxID=3273420 RepID=UPI0036150649
MQQDQWAQWVLRRRDGDNPDVRVRVAPVIGAYRDKVLDRAAIVPGDVVLDVGTGDGLVGFGALDRVGPTGRIIFSDISPGLLAECWRRATADGRLDQCRFVQAPADDLRQIPGRSVDVVTTRSVLIYVHRKEAAFAEFFRVLRPGGRLSIFEPINGFAASDARRGLFGLDMSPIADLLAKVWGAYTSVPAAQNPMLNFDERDLLRWARAAGFTGIELDYRAEVEVPSPLPSRDWAVLRKTAPNPLAPTYEEALNQTLEPAEREQVEAYLSAALANGATGHRTIATAYLKAVRP